MKIKFEFKNKRVSCDRVYDIKRQRVYFVSMLLVDGVDLVIDDSYFSLTYKKEYDNYNYLFHRAYEYNHIPFIQFNYFLIPYQFSIFVRNTTYRSKPPFKHILLEKHQEKLSTNDLLTQVLLL